MANNDRLRGRQRLEWEYKVSARSVVPRDKETARPAEAELRRGESLDKILLLLCLDSQKLEGISYNVRILQAGFSAVKGNNVFCFF